jgi:hypothetical protein
VYIDLKGPDSIATVSLQKYQLAGLLPYRQLQSPVARRRRGYASSASVDRAHFVTARDIDLKLCTYVPLGHMTYQAKFQSNLILGLATRGPKLKTEKVL